LEGKKSAECSPAAMRRVRGESGPRSECKGRRKKKGVASTSLRGGKGKIIGREEIAGDRKTESWAVLGGFLLATLPATWEKKKKLKLGGVG